MISETWNNYKSLNLFHDSRKAGYHQILVLLPLGKWQLASPRCKHVNNVQTLARVWLKWKWMVSVPRQHVNVKVGARGQSHCEDPSKYKFPVPSELQFNHHFLKSSQHPATVIWDLVKVFEAQDQRKATGSCKSRNEGKVRQRETLAWGEGQRLESAGGAGICVRGWRKLGRMWSSSTQEEIKQHGLGSRKRKQKSSQECEQQRRQEERARAVHCRRPWKLRKARALWWAAV